MSGTVNTNSQLRRENRNSVAVILPVVYGSEALSLT